MRWLPLVALLVLAACAADRSRPLSLVRHPLYQAVGGPPGWTLAVGREEIVLRLAPEAGAGPGGAAMTWRYPSPRAGLEGGVKRWEAGAGTRTIAVEARRSACANGAVRFEDEVRIRLGGRELTGCGGRIRPGRRRR